MAQRLTRKLLRSLSIRPRLEALEDRLVPSAAGTLDLSFGQQGVTHIDFGTTNPTRNSAANAVAIDSSGRSVLAGYVADAGGDQDWALARLNTDGSLDTTFGTGGMVRLGFNLGGNNNDVANGIAIDSTGHIVVVGYATRAAGTGGAPDNTDFAIARFNPNGTLDTTFNGTGTRVIAFDIGGSKEDKATSVVIQPDGRIVVAGWACVGPQTDFTRPGENDDYACVRLNTNGTLDTTFNNTGKQTVAFDFGGNFEDKAYSVALQSNGKIVMGGTSEHVLNETDWDMTACRLNTNGKLDNTFGSSGLALAFFDLGGNSNPPDYEDRAFAMTIDSSDRVILAGLSAIDPTDKRMAVARFDKNGTLDPAFSNTGQDGESVIPFDAAGGHNAVAFGVTVQPDGKIVTVGFVNYANSPTDEDFAIGRLNTDGSLDTTFSNDGTQTVPLDLGGSDADECHAVAIQPDGKIVAVGFAGVKFKTSDMAAARLLVQNAPAPGFTVSGPSSGRFGQAVSVIATLVPSSGQPVSGTVTFLDNGVPLGAAPLDGTGHASLTFTLAHKGTYTVTASYPGDTANPPASTSNSVTITVQDVQTVGAFDPTSGTWFLRNGVGGGAAAFTFQYGLPGWRPVVGDWLGTGRSTPAVVDPNTETWYVHSSNDAGFPDLGVFQYGLPGWIPVAGDWNGDGRDSVGAFDPSTATWYLSNELGGFPDAGVFQFGAPGWIPVVGDWTGSGHTGIGLFDPNTATWYLRSTATPGAPDVGTFAFGGRGWQPVVGDWDGDGKTTIGVVDPTGTWSLRNSNSAGGADIAPFGYGLGSWTPLAGQWAFPTASQTLVTDATGTGTQTLSNSDLQHMVGAALARLSTIEVDPVLISRLLAAQYQVQPLSGSTLVQAFPEENLVVFNATAAGRGWFVDPSPQSDTEFDASGVAPAGTPAANGVDLLTAVLHGMANLVGVANDSGPPVTASVLPAGVRRTQQLDLLFTSVIL